MTYTEDELIEQPAINLYSDIGWEKHDCYSEVFGENGSLGRDNRSEVILVRELRKTFEHEIRVGPSASRMTWEFIFKKHTIFRLRSPFLMSKMRF